VIRTLASGAGVLCLDGVDELTGELEVVLAADPRQIGRVKPSGAGLGVSSLDVACEVSEPPVRCRLPLVPDDHRCPTRRFTARWTSMTDSMSSSLSLR
jgi:hypothetical protein